MLLITASPAGLIWEMWAKVVFERIERTGRLYELGIAEEVLHYAIRYGQGFASECTAHEPSGLPGILAWGKTMRALRDRLVPNGWTASSGKNYATVVNPSGEFAIAVAAGDQNTGLRKENPSNRVGKGPQTEEAIDMNHSQLSFASLSSEFAETKQQTWMFLHYVDTGADEVKCELSLPSAITDGS